MKGRSFRRNFRSLSLLTMILLVLTPWQISFAQDVAIGQATATVQASLIVTSTNDLIFGNVLQGVAKSVGNNVDANSGQFSIAGQASAGINVYFTLPDYMALADGSDRMTISFSNTDCIVDTTTVTPSTAAPVDGWTDVNPRGLSSLAPSGVVIGAGGQTNLYLGGKVTPTVDQKAGAYTGDITCTVAYNGT